MQQVNANVRRPFGLTGATRALTLAIESNHELRRYFEYSSSGVEVVADGLQEISFGEYLVGADVLDRYQLFRALQMQDRLPGVRLGECAAALGYAPIGKIEKLYAQFAALSTVMI